MSDATTTDATTAALERSTVALSWQCSNDVACVTLPSRAVVAAQVVEEASTHPDRSAVYTLIVALVREGRVDGALHRLRIAAETGLGDVVFLPALAPEERVVRASIERSEDSLVRVSFIVAQGEDIHTSSEYASVFRYDSHDTLTRLWHGAGTVVESRFGRCVIERDVRFRLASPSSLEINATNRATFRAGEAMDPASLRALRRDCRTSAPAVERQTVSWASP